MSDGLIWDLEFTLCFQILFPWSELSFLKLNSLSYRQCLHALSMRKKGVERRLVLLPGSIENLSRSMYRVESLGSISGGCHMKPTATASHSSAGRFSCASRLGHAFCWKRWKLRKICTWDQSGTENNSPKPENLINCARGTILCTMGCLSILIH